MKVQVEGSIPATVPDGATAEMTISLELTQTAEDYPDAGCE